MIDVWLIYCHTYCIRLVHLTLTSEHAYDMRSYKRSMRIFTLRPVSCVYTELTVSTDKPNSKAFLPTTTTGYRRTNDSRCLLCSMQ